MTKIPEVNFTSKPSVSFEDIMENSNSSDTNFSAKMTNFSIDAIMNRIERPSSLESMILGKNLFKNIFSVI